MKSCIYLRVSTQMQGVSGLGIEAQRNTCMNYIKKSGNEFVDEFKDVESGKSRTRVGLMDAIDFCKKNDCELVFAKLDRLARDVEFTFKVINTGIKVHFFFFLQLNTLILGVMATVAQYERELISQRTKAALKAKKEKGGTTNLWGRKKGNTDRISAINKAAEASANSRREKARNKPENISFWEFITDWQAIHGQINAETDWQVISDELNRRKKVTSSGLPFNKNRAKAMFTSLQHIFND